MLHIIWVAIVFLVGFLIWYYDQPLRAFVKSLIGHRMDKAEKEVKKFVKETAPELVNKETTDKQE